MMDAGELRRRAEALLPRLTDLRRRLHRRPELSYHETGTQALLRDELTAAGFRTTEVAGTGLLAVGPGGGATPRVALRADMDALPITEQTEADYHSLAPGVMHACGHDAHMAMTFGAGLLLWEMGDAVAARVRLLFQPAEEVPPGGARRVLEAGVLAAESVGCIFGLHVDPRYPAGTVLLRRGPLMAASDRFRLTVIGRGGHGGYPHLAIDPIVTAAQIVLGLQTLVSRRLEPTEPGVITIGRIEGGSADNVIPERVTLTGTLRSHSDAVRQDLPRWIETLASGIAQGAGARIEFEYQPGHPGLSNDPALVDCVEAALVPLFGREAVIDLPKPIMGGEDFAHYLREFPGVFLRVGVRNEALGCVHPLHSPRFNLDESALAVGAAALAGAAAAWLAASPPGAGFAEPDLLSLR